jgi:G3E family GTPase
MLITNLAKTMEYINRKSENSKIPVSIITGYLGAGKSTIVLNLLKQLEHPERTVWLKNEYGNDNVDQLLLAETAVIPKEILNGCLCCVLVGRLEVALREIYRDYKPERVIIETSGTAWPGPIVRQVSRVEEFFVDSVAYVVDCINFSGFDDHSYVSKLESEFVDVVVLNKYPEFAAPDSQLEHEFEKKLDDVYSVFPKTKKIRSVDGKIDKAELIGLRESMLSSPDQTSDNHNDHPDEVYTVRVELAESVKLNKLSEALKTLNDLGVIRVKGVVKEGVNYFLVNSVFTQANYLLQPEYRGELYLVCFCNQPGITEQVVSEELAVAFE